MISDALRGPADFYPGPASAGGRGLDKPARKRAAGRPWSESPAGGPGPGSETGSRAGETGPSQVGGAHGRQYSAAEEFRFASTIGRWCLLSWLGRRRAPGQGRKGSLARTRL